MGDEFDDTTREEGVQAACRVAGAITDLTERWYAMRCFADSPEDVSARIKGGEVVEGKVETFIPVASQGGKNMADGEDAVFPLHVGRSGCVEKPPGEGCACVFVSRQRTHACLYQHRRDDGIYVPG